MTTAPPRPRTGAARAAPPRRPAARRGPTGARAHARRLKICRIVLVLALGAATMKLVVMQTVQAGSLAAASERQSITNIPLPAERGEIIDRAGNPLAFSVEARALVTNPRLIAATRGADALRYKTEMAAAVAQATGQDQATLLGVLTSDKGYVVLAKLVDPEIARDVRNRFPEIAEERREDRQYPAGTLAANVDRHRRPGTPTSASCVGRVGLESSQNNTLAGSEGLRVVDTAENSNAVIPGSTRFERPATQGSDVRAHPGLRPAVHGAAGAGRLRGPHRRSLDVVGRRAGRAQRRGARDGQRADVRPAQPGRGRPRAAGQPGGADPVRARLGEQDRHDGGGAGVRRGHARTTC